jgi:branched-chain amino acid transport system ATP-binding protein
LCKTLYPVFRIGEFFLALKDTNKRGISVLLVEQNISLALGVAQRGYALKVGRIVLEGDIEKFKASAVIREVYLGK